MKNFFNELASNIDTYIMFKIKEKAANLTDELNKKGRSPISLSMGAPTLYPPQILFDKFKQALDENNLHTYSNPKGEKYFLEAVKTRMQNRFGVNIELDEICSLLGSKEGIANLMRGIISPDKKDNDRDIIMIPDPSYASYKDMIKVSGGISYSIPLTKENNFMPDMDIVWENMKQEGYNTSNVKALMINYPNNPMGATCTIEYLKQVVEFCKKHEILLISDAAYVDIYFDEKDKPSSVLEVDGAKDIAIEFHSFSKPYAITGWRAGWVCGNREVVQRLAKLKSTIDSGLFKCIQKAVSQVLNSKEGDEYIVNANKLIKEKSDYFVNAFKEELNWEFDNVPKATFYQWIPIPPRYKNATEFCDELLTKSGIVTVPGDAFGKYGAGHIRISIVCSMDELKEAVRRMKEDGFIYK